MNIGTFIDSIISPGFRAFALTPVINSVIETYRVSVDDFNCIDASIATSTGIVSPAGDAVAKLPPKVPALRICGEPTVLAACAKAGKNADNWGCVKSV